MIDPMNEDIRKNADKIIHNHMAWSMGAGLIPVPVVDFFAVSAIQLDMIRQLCKLYEKDFKETDGRAIVSALTGSGLARLGAQAVKFIPGVGTVLGGITMSILSGASTYAVGGVFKKHFETGGTILDFDMERLKKMYNELFEKGKELASEMKEKQESKSESSKEDVIEKLKSLAELKEKGLIDEEEYEKLKKQLIQKGG